MPRKEEWEKRSEREGDGRVNLTGDSIFLTNLPGVLPETSSVETCGASRHGCAKAVILLQEDAGTASKDETELFDGPESATFSFAEFSFHPPGHLVEFLRLLRPEENPNLIPGPAADLPVHLGGFLSRFAERFPSRLQDPAHLDFLVRVQIQNPIQVLEEPRPVAAGLSRLSRRRPAIRAATGMVLRRPDQDMSQNATDETAREEYEDDPEDGLSSIRQ